MAYAVAGFFAALAGLFFSSQTGSGSPVVGTQFILPSIAAVVIGGTSLAGGRGGVVGTVIGALILSQIADVIFLVGMSSYGQQVASGLILVGVVLLTPLLEVAAERTGRRGRAGMSGLLARLRSPGPILLSYIGLAVLFLLISIFSPGFARPQPRDDAVDRRVVHGDRRDRSDGRHHRRRHRPVRAVDAQLRRGHADGAGPRRGRPAHLDHPPHPARGRAGRGRQRRRDRHPARSAHRHDPRDEHRPPGSLVHRDQRLSSAPTPEDVVAGHRPDRSRPGDPGRSGRSSPSRSSSRERRTSFGRYLYAVGSSRTVATFSGVPVARTTITAYAVSGARAALAGILLDGYADSPISGWATRILFTSIAAVAIGGTSILGGSGSYLGTIAGALILTVLTGLLPILRLDSGAPERHLRNGHPRDRGTRRTDDAAPPRASCARRRMSAPVPGE